MIHATRLNPCAVGAAPPQAASSFKVSTDPACRTGDPLANVYHASRLKVIIPCLTVTGTVERGASASDFDLVVYLRPDPEFIPLLNVHNREYPLNPRGDLVLKVVPADRPGCQVGSPPRPKHGTYDYGICTGANLMPIGNAGVDRITVTGAYVLDTARGRMEVHPVWSWSLTASPTAR